MREKVWLLIRLHLHLHRPVQALTKVTMEIVLFANCQSRVLTTILLQKVALSDVLIHPIQFAVLVKSSTFDTVQELFQHCTVRVDVTTV